MNFLGSHINEQVALELKKKDVTEADIVLVDEKGGALAVGVFVDAFMMCLRKVKNTFRIMVGGNRQTEEMVVAGNYSMNWDNPLLTEKHLPMRPMRKGSLEIEFLEFDHDPTYEEVLREGGRWGLKQPRYEDAFFFGEQYPGEQSRGTIVFMHEPWENPVGDVGVMMLSDGERGRSIGIHLIRYGFKKGWRFAFIRPALPA